MEILGFIQQYIVHFLIFLTILVFVHELGHYALAKWNGVRVEVFSIGFGPELFGWTDRSGTRWKFSTVPLGGYVTMYGDSNAASMPADPPVELTPEERKVSFHHKSLGQRAAVVFAGPAANYIFAIALMTGLFAAYGEPFTPARVGGVVPGSAAEAAGVKTGDMVSSLDGQTIERFEDVQMAIKLNPGKTMIMMVQRDGQTLSLTVTPKTVPETDFLGNHRQIGRLGITGSAPEFRRLGPFDAFGEATTQAFSLSWDMLSAIGQMMIGARSADELGGPVAIAKMSGRVSELGFENILWFMAVLSLNLGLVNLLPVPMLDGGHLAFYAVEAATGRPLGRRTQEWGFRIGFALVLSLVLFVTWNDIAKLPVAEFIRGILS
jgi:regulator of sigma E protease